MSFSTSFSFQIPEQHGLVSEEFIRGGGGGGGGYYFVSAGFGFILPQAQLYIDSR